MCRTEKPPMDFGSHHPAESASGPLKPHDRLPHLWAPSQTPLCPPPETLPLWEKYMVVNTWLLHG